MSPSLLANVGVLCMTGEDVGWKMMVATWIERQTEMDNEILRSMCNQYLEVVITYLEDSTRPPLLGIPKSGTRFRHVIWQSQEAMISTFMTLFDVSRSSSDEAMIGTCLM